MSSTALFDVDFARPRSLWIADEGFEDIAAFATESVDRFSAMLVLLGASTGFPFRARPSTIIVPGMPEGVIASMPALENAGIASRLASGAGLPGCFEGSVVDLAGEWLAAQPSTALEEITLYALGGAELLKAAAELARRFEVPVGLPVSRS